MSHANLNLLGRQVPKHYQNTFRAACNKVVENVRLTGCSVFRGFRADGVSQINVLVSPKYQQHARHDINELLNKKDRPWQLWVGLFGLNDAGEKCFEIEICEHQTMNADNLGQWIDGIIKDLSEEGERDWELIGYGWVATPSLKGSLDESDENIIAHFESLGIYNVEKRDALIQDVLENPEGGNEADLYSIDGVTFEKVYREPEEDNVSAS